MPHSLVPCPPRAKTICRSRQGGDRLPSDHLLQEPGTGDLGRSLQRAPASQVNILIAAELGFTDVLAHWPRRSSWFAGDEKVLEVVPLEALKRHALDLH